MTKRFEVLNPLNGTYVSAADEDELITTMAGIAMSLYMSHVHQQPYSVVETLESGGERWSSPSGEDILSPEQMARLMAQMESNVAALADATQNSTPPQPSPT